MAATTDTGELYDQLRSLQQHMHALVVARSKRLGTPAATQLEQEIAVTGQQYNGVVARLRDIEGPSSALVMLDTVSDVLIDGLKAGAVGAMNAAGDVVNAAGNIVVGIGTLARWLPYIIAGIVVVVGIGFYTGAFKLRGSDLRP